MRSLLQDLKHSLRVLRRSPGFTCTAVVTLALGIGANAAIFSVVDAVMLKPVAAPEPDRVVVFLATNKAGAGAIASDIKFNLWRAQTGVFQDVAALHRGAFNLTGTGRPQRADALFVTADYFRLFGLPVAQGRGFTEDEERTKDARVVILGYAFWKSAFNADPRMIGKGILLGDASYQVIGVMAEGVSVENFEPPDVWLPFPIDPNSSNQVHYFEALGRLKPGVPLEMANAQLQLTTQEFRRRYPHALSTGRGDVFSVQPLRDFLVKDVRMSLLTLACAVGFVLLIACANVANLLLSRAEGRRREVAIRVAVGASRGRIVRQFLTESALLSAAGAACGLALGTAGIRLLLAMNAVAVPRLGEKAANVGMDWRVLAFTVSIAAATGILFGLVPSLQASRADLSSIIKAGNFRRNLAGSLLTVSETSFAVLLLIGAALFIRTLIALRSVNPGFDPRHLAVTQATLEPRHADDLFRRLDAMPGVEGAALTGLLPLEGGFNSLTITIAGRPLDGVSHGNSRWMTVSPGYFDVLKIPLLRGRVFTAADRLDAPAVAIVNQAMARQFWPAGDPLGERLIIGRGLGQNFEEPTREVVGIVADVHDDSLGQAPTPAVYVPFAQRPDNRAALMWVVVRTRGQSRATDAAIQREVRDATGGLPVPPLRAMQEILVRSTARQDFHMILMSIFGALALVLAAIGIYGLMAYSVQRRTREIGIRMALGAQSSAVRNMVVLHGMRLTLTGAAVGIAAAFYLTRLLTSFLFGVKAVDPFVFAVAPVLMTAVALLAVWLPARRASRIDPIQALRVE